MSKGLKGVGGGKGNIIFFLRPCLIRLVKLLQTSSLNFVIGAKASHNTIFIAIAIAIAIKMSFLQGIKSINIPNEQRLN